MGSKSCSDSYQDIKGGWQGVMRLKKVIVLGKINIDVFYYVDDVKVGGNHVTQNTLLALGGKGANISIALAKLGVPVGIIGAVGEDIFGETALKELEKYGVDISRVIRVKGKTGFTTVVVDSKGENTMFNSLGANAHFSPEHIDWTFIDEYDILVAQAGVPPGTFLEIVSMAKRSGMTVFVDTSYPSEIPEEAYSYMDYISPNLRELAGITGLNDPLKGARKLINKGVETVIVKMGKEGALIVDEKDSKHIKALDVEAVDTTGAGDAFDAGFILGKIKGLSDEESVGLGNVCAAISVTKKGASTSSPSIEELRNFIRERELNVKGL
ncbi:MAG TPA: ribokinase [Thermotoga sp.]|nr:MAG: ribokinase [Thermotogota bacterium]RKX51326.1 MAG: ribokinase [Thermotoga sp.]HDG61484.1 ribokinase [Thermotoga sp.]